MKIIKAYLKKNIPVLIKFAFIIMLELTYMYMLGIGIEDIGYCALLGGVVAFIFLLAGIPSYWKKYTDLTQLSLRPAEELCDIAESEDAIENLYISIIENINSAMRENISMTDKKQEQMREYYAKWVHQIKTPIAAMSLLLQEQKNSAVQLADADDMHENKYASILENLSDMEDKIFDIEEYVNMALQYQRISGLSDDYIFKCVPLDRVIRETIRKYAKAMIKKRISVSYEGTELNVYTDEKCIAFILEQIMSNAVKYTTGGSITIELVNEPNWRFIKISDTGMGIKQEDLPRIFEKGYTGYNGHADKKSTGIGLFLCKQLLCRLGHTIRVESEEAKGTSVWIGFCNKK